MHRRDESAHSTAFREIVASVYRALDPGAKTSFRAYMLEALTDFTSPDMSSWASILQYMEVPGRQRILAELEETARSKRLSRDYTVLLSLFEELGIEREIGFSFE
jgi:hypothetical protein